MQQPITITLNLQLKLKVKWKDNQPTIEAESEEEVQLRKKLALMLSTAWTEWTGYPLVCSGSKSGTLINYKIWGNTVQQEIPSEYTQLEYIQSSGTQYIDTGINPASKKIGMVLDYQLTSTVSNDQISGSFGSDGVDNFQWSEYSTSGSIKWRWKLGTVAGYGDTCDTNRHTIYFNTDTGITLDTTSLTTTQYTIPSTNTYSIYLGARHSNTPQPCKAKFYRAKYYDYTSGSAVLLVDFIPAKRNSDNAIGMYDKVSGTFFTNAGTRTFTAGDTITPSPSSPVDVLSVGDKVTDSSDPHYGEYKIPVIASNEAGTETTTTNIYLDEPLRKIGDYADYIDYGNQQVVRNVGHKVFDGTESWSLNASIASLFQAQISGSKSQTVSPYIGLCSHFINANKTAGNIVNGECTFQAIGTANARISIRYTDYTAVADFKTWLASQYSAGTPVEVVYPLATATTESITLSALPTYAGYTKFETDTTVKASDMWGKG